MSSLRNKGYTLLALSNERRREESCKESHRGFRLRSPLPPRPFQSCHPERIEGSAFRSPFTPSLNRRDRFPPVFPSSVNSGPSVSKSPFTPATARPRTCGSRPKESQTVTISFRITSFAHPHQLTPIESHSYKKQGEGVSQRRLFTQAVPLFPQRVNLQRTATPATSFHSCVYSTLLWTPGGYPLHTTSPVAILRFLVLPRPDVFHNPCGISPFLTLFKNCRETPSRHYRFWVPKHDGPPAIGQ
jgi:hypothetical protein